MYAVKSRKKERVKEQIFNDKIIKNNKKNTKLTV